MHPVRRKKLVKLLIPVCLLALVVALVMYALRQNISLFYTPTEVSLGSAPKALNIRMGGRVVEGSILRGNDLNIQFKLTDMNQTVLVHYAGLLPDLFREGQGLVVEGHVLDSGAFDAQRVLAKHDENYMPPEAAAALMKGEQAQKEAKT
ncbi:MAG: cytochrome c maturation protein CcmE [Gammaproteobacteria bacterium]|nr:cytochrome c maturation protein CcmE [Gammaproteobacteria bacterium]MCH9763520.1 cytochrome c maturation protein CcmE [Gammaproteobacteria bacterium]